MRSSLLQMLDDFENVFVVYIIIISFVVKLRPLEHVTQQPPAAVEMIDQVGVHLTPVPHTS